MDRRIIRGYAAPIIPKARFEAERHARSIAKNAEERARESVARAEAAAEAIVRSAHAERESLREAQRAEGDRERDAVVARSASDVLLLGVELARRITRLELARDAEAYAAMAEALIAEARIEGPGWLGIPEGVAISIEGFESVVDSSLGPADLVAETEGARLDARLDERLAELARALETPKTS